MRQLRGCRCRLGSTVGTAKSRHFKIVDQKKKQSAGFGAALTAASGRATMSVICPRGSMSLLSSPDKRNARAATHAAHHPLVFLLQRSLLHALIDRDPPSPTRGWPRSSREINSADHTVSGARRDSRGDLAAQTLQAMQRFCAGFRHLDALGDEMFLEEIEMCLALVELLRRQHRREHGHFGSKLHVHQRLDHGVSYEFMAIDAAIHYEAGRDNRGVAPRLGQ